MRECIRSVPEKRGQAYAEEIRRERGSMDLYSRDYNIHEIGEEDQRLKDCRREGLLVQTLAFAATFLGIILAYALSPTQEEIAAGAKVASLFGYPVWALVPAAVFFAQALVMVVLAAKVLKRPPLDARYQEQEEKGGDVL